MRAGKLVLLLGILALTACAGNEARLAARVEFLESKIRTQESGEEYAKKMNQKNQDTETVFFPNGYATKKEIFSALEGRVVQGIYFKRIKRSCLSNDDCITPAEICSQQRCEENLIQGLDLTGMGVE